MIRTLLAVLAVAAPVHAMAAVLTPDGFGPLKIGMTRQQVTAVYGPDRHPGPIGGPAPAVCDQYQPRRAPPGLMVMLEHDRLTRISIARNVWLRTADGIGIGFRKGAVLAQLAPTAQISAHKYWPRPAAYIDHWRGKPGASRGIRYEIGTNNQVAAIHAGAPSIAYVEGCL